MISMSYEQIMLNSVLEYLELMGEDYSYDPDRKKVIIVKNIMGRRVEIAVSFSESWITTYYIGPSIADLDDKKKLEIMRRMLQINDKTGEVKFCLTQDDRISISVESNIIGLTFDNYYIEFGAVVYAIKLLFKELLPIIAGKEEKEEEEEEEEEEEDVLKKVLLGALARMAQQHD